jgi:hypothetical protein
MSQKKHNHWGRREGGTFFIHTQWAIIIESAKHQQFSIFFFINTHHCNMEQNSPWNKMMLSKKQMKYMKK